MKKYIVHVGNGGSLVCSQYVMAYDEEQACNMVACWLEDNRPNWKVDSFTAKMAE